MVNYHSTPGAARIYTHRAPQIRECLCWCREGRIRARPPVGAYLGLVGQLRRSRASATTTTTTTTRAFVSPRRAQWGSLGDGGTERDGAGARLGGLDGPGAEYQQDQRQPRRGRPRYEVALVEHERARRRGARLWRAAAHLRCWICGERENTFFTRLSVEFVGDGGFLASGKVVLGMRGDRGILIIN